MADHEYGFRTRAIHAGNIPDPVTGARAVPIYQTSAFVFDDTEDAAARFALQKYGTVYSRLANPTVAAFEERMRAFVEANQEIGRMHVSSLEAPEPDAAPAPEPDMEALMALVERAIRRVG